jgi:hypothetical protein
LIKFIFAGVKNMENKTIMNEPEINLELEDNEWQFEYVDHDRQIARAIVGNLFCNLIVDVIHVDKI